MRDGKMIIHSQASKSSIMNSIGRILDRITIDTINAIL